MSFTISDGVSRYHHGRVKSEKAESRYAPTLYIGLGGSGVEIVGRLKQRIPDSALQTEPLAFLGIDVDYRRRRDHALGEEEFFYAAPPVMSRVNELTALALRWLAPALAPSSLAAMHSGAGQQRHLGRLALTLHSEEIAKAIAVAAAKIGPAADSARAYVIASLAGGTGTGMLFDVAAILQDLGFLGSVDAVLLLPQVFYGLAGNRMQPTAFATLVEIAALETERIDLPFKPAKEGLFRRVYLQGAQSAADPYATFDTVAETVEMMSFADIHQRQSRHEPRVSHEDGGVFSAAVTTAVRLAEPFAWRESSDEIPAKLVDDLSALVNERIRIVGEPSAEELIRRIEDVGLAALIQAWEAQQAEIARALDRMHDDVRERVRTLLRAHRHVPASIISEEDSRLPELPPRELDDNRRRFVFSTVENASRKFFLRQRLVREAVKGAVAELRRQREREILRWVIAVIVETAEEFAFSSVLADKAAAALAKIDTAVFDRQRYAAPSARTVVTLLVPRNIEGSDDIAKLLAEMARLRFGTGPILIRSERDTDREIVLLVEWLFYPTVAIRGIFELEEEYRKEPDRTTYHFDKNWPALLADVIDSIGGGRRIAPRKRNFDIGLIVPLHEEFNVVSSHWPIKDSQISEGTTFLELDMSASGVTCIATVQREMGLSVATSRTEKLLNFADVSLVVLVGIAGSLSSDVELGDIVIADEVAEFNAASKAVPDGDTAFKLVYSGFHFRADYSLIEAIVHWPHLAKDDHREWQNGIRGRAPQLDDGRPRMNIAHVASGDTVGAAEAFRVELPGIDRRFSALEEQAAAIAAAAAARQHSVPFLILRGISDYSDERKKELDRSEKGTWRSLAVHSACDALTRLLRLQAVRDAAKLSGS